MKYTSSLLAAAMIAGSAGIAQAQQAPPPPPPARVQAGTLNCGVAPGVSFVFGSTKAVNCVYYSSDGIAERYIGEISRFGVDLGFTNAGVMTWLVLAGTARIPPGTLSGVYVGATAAATPGVGGAANVLIGGGNSVALQPLSVEGNTGLNIAFGIGELRLRR
jgi:hypothetical protein